MSAESKPPKMAMHYAVPAQRSDVLGTFLSSTGPSIYSPHRPEKTEWKLRDQGLFCATLLTWTHSLSCRFGTQRPSRAKRLMLRVSGPDLQFEELRARGEAKRRVGDFAGAIEYLDKALELEPEDAWALRSRGEAKRMLDDFGGAFADLNLALELEPKNAFALTSRGAALKELGVFEGAMSDLDEALKLEPENALALSIRDNLQSEELRRRGEVKIGFGGFS